MSEICRRCGVVACGQCSGWYDPHVPIEYHYRHACNYRMRQMQAEKDKRRYDDKPVNDKAAQMIEEIFTKALAKIEK